jgi:hypothetical protein
MEENNPITRHRKLQMSLVASWVYFICHRETGTHARMRHVSLNRNVRAGNWLGGGIGQPQSDRSGADPCWFRRNFVFNRDNS